MTQSTGLLGARSNPALRWLPVTASLIGLIGVGQIAIAGWLWWQAAHPPPRPATVTATLSDCRVRPVITSPPVTGVYGYNCTVSWPGGSRVDGVFEPEPVNPDGTTFVMDTPAPPPAKAWPPFLAFGMGVNSLATAATFMRIARRRSAGAVR